MLTDFFEYMSTRMRGTVIVERKNVGLWLANFRCPAIDLQLTYVGKPSAIGQPTRPTQPFILSGLRNE